MPANGTGRGFAAITLQSAKKTLILKVPWALTCRPRSSSSVGVCQFLFGLVLARLRLPYAPSTSDPPSQRKGSTPEPSDGYTLRQSASPPKVL